MDEHTYDINLTFRMQEVSANSETGKEGTPTAGAQDGHLSDINVHERQEERLSANSETGREERPAVGPGRAPFGINLRILDTGGWNCSPTVKRVKAGFGAGLVAQTGDNCL